MRNRVSRGVSMTTETTLPVEERIRQLLQHLGIDQAHFAGRLSRDWIGLAATHPEVFASLTLVGPMAVDPYTVRDVASKLLVCTGDQGPIAAAVRTAMDRMPDAQLVTLH